MPVIKSAVPSLCRQSAPAVSGFIYNYVLFQLFIVFIVPQLRALATAGYHRADRAGAKMTALPYKNNRRSGLTECSERIIFFHIISVFLTEKTYAGENNSI
ncbi:MAG: hypothetical protein U5L02_16045 [Rheinheimera sp.]|nr:hypothetical protein [Rheinheimera sp.]